MNALEGRIRRRLDEAYPCCTLSGVTLYRPDRFGNGDPFGYEIDNLLHWQSGGEDRLVIVECKDAPIQVAGVMTGIPPENQEWHASLIDGTKRNLKDQLFNQAESIWQNLCVPPNPRRRIDAMVVTSAPIDRLKCRLYSEHGLTLHLLNEMDLIELLRSPRKLAEVFDTGRDGRFLRVAQSDLLRLARQSVIVPELGHPEIDQAIEMLRRCRQTLDGRLFDYFYPKEGRWAINGSAGMGKSVLLAYAVTVLATGKVLRDVPRHRNERRPHSTELVDQSIDGLGLPGLNERRILVVGLKQKQLDVLEACWADFHGRFQRLAGHYLPYVQPNFRRWAPWLDLTPYNVVCIDEAHDLPPADQARVAEWWNDRNRGHYLLIACDRHQKLRLAGDDEKRWMLHGVSFSGCSTRLARNYRSPTPIYCAGLALMFRWFARNGPKVVPEKEELEQSFGFQVRLLERRKEGRVALSLVNDAHPGNHWRFTVSRFTHTDAACAWLAGNKIQVNDVLWVRFGEQDPDVDYEDIRRKFSYKTLNAADSDDTIDAEIKGREFPIVVIEGLPQGMASTEVNERVWLLRRQVYLCASRATAFLFFIYRDGNGSQPSGPLGEELDSMLAALASPDDPTSASTKTWSFEFSLPESPVGMDVFLDEAVAGSAEQANAAGIAPGIAPPSASSHDESAAKAVEVPAPAKAVYGIPTQESELPAEKAESTEAPGAQPVPSVRQHQTELPSSSAIPHGQLSLHAEPVPESPPQFRSPPRIHEVAQIVGWPPSELLRLFRERNYPVKNISSTIDRITADSLIKELRGKPAPNSTPSVAPEVASAQTEMAAGPGETQQLPLLSEKEFQRRYGHEKGWKQLHYERYLKTGVLPTYLKTRREAAQATQTARTSGSRLPISQPNLVHSNESHVAQKRPIFTPPLLTVRQLAQYLGVKPFKLISELMKYGVFLGVDQSVGHVTLENMCRVFGRHPPSNTQLIQLAAIPSAPQPAPNPSARSDPSEAQSAH